MLVGLILFPLGCASRVTPIGPGFIYEPQEDEKRLWNTTRGASSEIQKSGALYEDVQLQTYVQSVLDRLLGGHQQAYLPLTARVVVLDAPSPNAFAFPHGDIFVHKGLLGRMRNEAQLAMLLGHEITHATHRHTYQVVEHAYDSTGALAYVSVLSAAGGGNLQSAVTRVGQIMTIAAISGYNRDKEEEADRVGLTLMAQAGYDPREGAEMFARMLEATDPKRREPSLLYASHPRMKERVASCRKTAQRLPPELLAKAGEVGRDRYIDHVLPLIVEEVDRHISQGRFALAEETIQFLTETKPANAGVYALQGDLCRARNSDGDNERARSAYVKATELDALCAAAHRGMGLLCVRTGDKATALAELRVYLKLAPNGPDAAYVRQYVDRLSSEKP